MSDRTWRVLVADDHPVFRSGLRAIVDAADDMTVVAEAVNGAEAVELATAHEPDLILMDLHMPVLGGIEATRKILSQSPEVRVLVLTMIERDDAVMRRCAQARAVSRQGIGPRRGPSRYPRRGRGRCDLLVGSRRSPGCVACGRAGCTPCLPNLTERSDRSSSRWRAD